MLKVWEGQGCLSWASLPSQSTVPYPNPASVSRQESYWGEQLAPWSSVQARWGRLDLRGPGLGLRLYYRQKRQEPWPGQMAGARARACAHGGAAGPCAYARGRAAQSRDSPRPRWLWCPRAGTVTILGEEGLKVKRGCWVCGRDGEATAERKTSPLLLQCERPCEVAAAGEGLGGFQGGGQAVRRGHAFICQPCYDQTSSRQPGVSLCPLGNEGAPWDIALPFRGFNKTSRSS
jgi:hypothetical protein